VVRADTTGAATTTINTTNATNTANANNAGGGREEEEEEQEGEHRTTQGNQQKPGRNFRCPEKERYGPSTLDEHRKEKNAYISSTIHSVRYGGNAQS
jgi:hypothetical protein